MGDVFRVSQPARRRTVADSRAGVPVCVCVCVIARVRVMVHATPSRALRSSMVTFGAHRRDADAARMSLLTNRSRCFPLARAQKAALARVSALHKAGRVARAN